MLLLFAKQRALLYLFIYCINTERNWLFKNQTGNVSTRILWSESVKSITSIAHYCRAHPHTQKPVCYRQVMTLVLSGLEVLLKPIQRERPEGGLGGQGGQCILVVAGFLPFRAKWNTSAFLLFSSGPVAPISKSFVPFYHIDRPVLWQDYLCSSEVPFLTILVTVYNRWWCLDEHQNVLPFVLP